MVVAGFDCTIIQFTMYVGAKIRSRCMPTAGQSVVPQKQARTSQSDAAGCNPAKRDLGSHPSCQSFSLLLLFLISQLAIYLLLSLLPELFRDSCMSREFTHFEAIQVSLLWRHLSSLPR